MASKTNEYNLHEVKTFLEALSINLVFDSYFIKKEDDSKRDIHCPCNRGFDAWNQRTGVGSFICDHD